MPKRCSDLPPLKHLLHYGVRSPIGDGQVFPFTCGQENVLASRASEIVVTFKRPPHNIFEDRANASQEIEPNRLIIRLQPNEGLKLCLTSKEPGPGGMRLFPAGLNLSFDEAFKTRLPEAYERLLMDVARGNQTLFMRSG